MAIADGTDYTLKGSQVIDIANRIKGATLTAGNYIDITSGVISADIDPVGAFSYAETLTILEGEEES